MVAPANSLDDALDKIVALAEIPEGCKSHFRELVRWAINDLCTPNVKTLKPLSDDAALKLGSVTRNARALLAQLKTMEKGSLAGNALGLAGLSLRAATIVAAKDPGLIGRLIDQLELLIVLAEITDHKTRAHAGSKRGRPPGTPGNLGFDIFVRELLKEARRSGGDLTIYKSPSADGGWDGSLLKAIELLRYRLRRFVPKGSLGQRLHSIAHPRKRIARTAAKFPIAK